MPRPAPPHRTALHRTPPVLAAALGLLLAAACAQDPPALDPRCEAGATAIHAVQGDGPTSPLENRRTTVQGVVTAAFRVDPPAPRPFASPSNRPTWRSSRSTGVSAR